MESQKANDYVMVRMTAEFKARLKAEAEAQGRPLANYIRAIIKDHIDSIDRAKKIAERR